MKLSKVIKRGLYGLFTALLAISAQAFAGQDDLWVSNVNSVSVGGSDAAYTTSVAGASGNRSLTVTNAIVGTKNVSVQVRWAVAKSNDPRTTTWPNSGVTFSASTTQGIDVGTITVSPTICNFSTDAATCNTTISFSTPNVTDTVQVSVTPNPPSKSSGRQQLQPRKVQINFSVIQQIAKKDTALTLPNPQCFPYKGGVRGINARLIELATDDPIATRPIDFSIDLASVGQAYTDGTGWANLAYDIDGLTAGDHDLYAEFTGDSIYNGSSSSATLGIYYNFVGFQPPINPEGNSIFGNGRVIPVKIKIVDANLNPVIDAQPTVWIYQWSASTGLGEVLEAATSVSAADTDNIMRYVPVDQQYIYNMDLSNLVNGTYAIVVELGDSKACTAGHYSAVITVAKKGKK